MPAGPNAGSSLCSCRSAAPGTPADRIACFPRRQKQPGSLDRLRAIAKRRIHGFHAAADMTDGPLTAFAGDPTVGNRLHATCINECEPWHSARLNRHTGAIPVHDEDARMFSAAGGDQPCLLEIQAAFRGSPQNDGARRRIRTADTVIFSHVLYQLSYPGRKRWRGAYRGRIASLSRPSMSESSIAGPGMRYPSSSHCKRSRSRQPWLQNGS